MILSSSNLFVISNFFFSIMILSFLILSFCSPLSFLITSFSLSINIFSSCNRVTSSINFNFLVKYSPTSFPVALLFQMAFSTFLPIGLSKLEVSPNPDPQSPSPIDIDSRVGGTDDLHLALLGSANFDWSFNISQQWSRRKGFFCFSKYKTFALVI